MNRYFIAILGLLATAGPAAVWANVVSGTAARVPVYQARGATEVATVGPLATSLQGKPLVVRIHADWCPACEATLSTIDELRTAYTARTRTRQPTVDNPLT